MRVGKMISEIYIEEAIVILGNNIVSLSLVEYLNRENYYNTIIIDSVASKSGEKFIDVYNITGYIIYSDKINLDEGNLVVEKEKQIIIIKPVSIAIMEEKYLRLLQITDSKSLKIDYMFQSPALPNNIFISPSIILGKLPVNIEIRIGRLMGKQLNLKLLGIEKTPYIYLLCEDPRFLYVPYYASSNTETILVYKYAEPLKALKIDDITYQLNNRDTGILILKSIQVEMKKEIHINPIISS